MELSRRKLLQAVSAVPFLKLEPEPEPEPEPQVIIPGVYDITKYRLRLNKHIIKPYKIIINGDRYFGITLKGELRVEKTELFTHAVCTFNGRFIGKARLDRTVSVSIGDILRVNYTINDELWS